MNNNPAPKIAVIGAGISGLTCAYELQQAGFEVTVYEKNTYVGGRMSTRVKEGFPFDLGANHLCNLYDHMQEYCRKFEIPWTPMTFLKYGIWRKNKILPLEKAMGWWATLRFGWFIKDLKRDSDFFDLSSAAQYDTDNAYDFLKKHTGQEIADYLADGMTTTYQFHRAKEASLAALMAYMQSIKFDGEKWHLHRTRGGMSALPEALAKQLDVRLGKNIIKVTPGNKIQIQDEEQSYEFDAVVLATTADVTSWVLQDQTVNQKRVLDGTSYASSISLAYRVDEKLLPDTSIVWTPYIESQTISGYTNEKMKGPELIHDGKSLFCTWLHEEFAKTLLDKSNEEILSTCKKEVLKVCPWFTSEDQLESFDLERWVCAEPKFSQGHITRVKNFLDNGQGENRIFLCGDYLNAPWTEGALRCGQRVAEAVKGSFSTEAMTTPNTVVEEATVAENILEAERE